MKRPKLVVACSVVRAVAGVAALALFLGIDASWRYAFLVVAVGLTVSGIPAVLRRRQTPNDVLVPGRYSVELISSSDRPLLVIKTLRSAGLDFDGARSLEQHPPAVVVRDIAKRDADAVCHALQNCGAQARVVDGAGPTTPDSPG